MGVGSVRVHPFQSQQHLSVHTSTSTKIKHEALWWHKVQVITLTLDSPPLLTFSNMAQHSA